MTAQSEPYEMLPDDGPPEHERCACWWHGDRRLGWTEDDCCPLHPNDHVPEQEDHRDD